MTELKKNNNTLSFSAWAKEVFFTKRMNSLPGWIVMALAGIAIAFAGSQLGAKIPLLIMAGAAGFMFILACLYYPEFSYYVYLYSIVVFTLPDRVFNLNLPLGLLIEATGYLSVISILIVQYRKRVSSFNFWKTPISLMMLLLFFYLLLEAFNPQITVRSGWFNFFRKQIIYLLFYYASFLMFDSMEKIRRFVKYWVILATIVALWGIKQQWLGFTVAENAWIHNDPNTTNLLFQGGMFRKFSLLPDPASFGIMVTSSALFTLILAIRSPVKKIRIQLYIITFLQLVASTYSGTRTCTAMLVAGLFAYMLFTLNEKRTIVLLLSSTAIALFLLFGPTSNSPVISRIKTTFQGSREPSYMVRDINRRNIRPYVYAHPFGGGLQTSGEEGKKFYPWHPLAGYPPDSGYMKILLEQGWVGFTMTLIFYFIILQRGIAGFYSSRRREIKSLYIALTTCFFSLTVGQYSQSGISQYPQYLFYLATLVIFYKLKEYDTNKSGDHEPAIG